MIGVIDVQRLDAPVNIEQPSKRSRFEDVKVVLRNACIYANKGVCLAKRQLLALADVFW